MVLWACRHSNIYTSLSSRSCAQCPGFRRSRTPVTAQCAQNGKLSPEPEMQTATTARNEGKPITALPQFSVLYPACDRLQEKRGVQILVSATQYSVPYLAIYLVVPPTFNCSLAMPTFSFDRAAPKCPRFLPILLTPLEHRDHLL